uniref:BZIP domain-containing protein n=1 Tax=Globisporangium ultimum (strain ATCC 200006 / CBS 805.95 / DAOM BR144) TaxID=431595 RepID=K3X4U9_GLOUD
MSHSEYAAPAIPASLSPASAAALVIASRAPPLLPERRSSLGDGRRGRARAKSNSERARQFRQREKAHEDSLHREIHQLHQHIARLSLLKSVYAQKALVTRTSRCGSLEKLTVELYQAHRHGLETIDDADRTALTMSKSTAARYQSVQLKESFLHKMFDPDVRRGDLVGVDAIINQWRKHTSSYAKFDMEISHVEPITGSQEHPIIVIHTKMHVRFARETFSIMFPFAAGRRDDLVERVVGKDITLSCVSRFQFSEADQVTSYTVEIGFVDAFLKLLGDVNDVVELMKLSVISPGARLVDNATPERHRKRNRNRNDASEEERKAVFSDIPPHSYPIATPSLPSAKLSVQYLLTDELQARLSKNVPLDG